MDAIAMPPGTRNVTATLRRWGATISTILCLTAEFVIAQALQPPRDGEIRVLYRELQNETQVWLTLEPRTATGKPAPPLMLLTFTLTFPGKMPKAQPEHVELRAHAGLLWAPQVQLSLVIDKGERIELAPRGTVGLVSGDVSDYLTATLPISMLRQIAQAKRVRINALGIELELTGSQRKAVGEFLERVLSENPGQFKR